jgi:hypothetical protein
MHHAAATTTANNYLREHCVWVSCCPPLCLIGSGSVIIVPAIAVAVLIAMLPLSASGCPHTSAVLFSTIFLLFDS